MDNLHIGVVMIDSQMELKQINRQMRLWFPYLKGELGTWCFKEFARRQQSLRENLWAMEMFDFGATKKFTGTLTTSEGERIFKMLFYPVYDDSQHVTATIGLFEDITDALAAEHELRQAQKLEAIGQLAAGIAHEINTPVQYIGDNVRFLGDSFRDMAAVHEKSKHLLQVMKQSGYLSDLVRELENIGEAIDMDYLLEEIPGTIAQTLEGVNRVTTILRAMREFSHPGSEGKTPIDINRAIESTITISRNEWKYVANVETSLAADLPLLLCLPGEINQVILNLIINAAHAISDVTDKSNPGKGVIKVSTRADDHWMEISISDTGGGIPDSIQDRIFDPFFTTKKLGKGTGQGLAIARNVVVDKHQGVLRFTTEAGKGTTFIIQLPLH
ncbi:MAG: PAS/PAC sensor signal transduction histidine kinase [uncultured bacterium]|nr:MAG: PAS/PAC sensor signal transduction histidine kinase [uncultured bacterium]